MLDERKQTFWKRARKFIATDERQQFQGQLRRRFHTLDPLALAQPVVIFEHTADVALAKAEAELLADSLEDLVPVKGVVDIDVVSVDVNLQRCAEHARWSCNSANDLPAGSHPVFPDVDQDSVRQGRIKVGELTSFFRGHPVRVTGEGLGSSRDT